MITLCEIIHLEYRTSQLCWFVMFHHILPTRRSLCHREPPWRHNTFRGALVPVHSSDGCHCRNNGRRWSNLFRRIRRSCTDAVLQPQDRGKHEVEHHYPKTRQSSSSIIALDKDWTDATHHSQHTSAYPFQCHRESPFKLCLIAETLSTWGTPDGS